MNVNVGRSTAVHVMKHVMYVCESNHMAMSVAVNACMCAHVYVCE